MYSFLAPVSKQWSRLHPFISVHSRLPTLKISQESVCNLPSYPDQTCRSQSLVRGKHSFVYRRGKSASLTVTGHGASCTTAVTSRALHAEDAAAAAVMVRMLQSQTRVVLVRTVECWESAADDLDSAALTHSTHSHQQPSLLLLLVLVLVLVRLVVRLRSAAHLNINKHIAHLRLHRLSKQLKQKLHSILCSYT